MHDHSTDNRPYFLFSDLFYSILYSLDFSSRTSKIAGTDKQNGVVLMATFSYKGYSIHYTCEGEGKPIVFIHGLGGNSINWLYQRNHFKQHYQVIAIDLPGHGKSEGREELNFFDYQAVLSELLMVELELDDLLVCGISMGGKVALDFASRHPETVIGLMLADTFAGLDEEEKKRRKATWDLIYQPNGVDRWVERVIDEMGLDPQGAIAKGFQKGILSNQLDFMYKLFAQLLEYDQRDQLQVIKVPVFVLHGERDRFIARSCAEEIYQGLVNSELHIVADCGHLPNVEQPKVFNELLGGLISRVWR